MRRVSILVITTVVLAACGDSVATSPNEPLEAPRALGAARETGASAVAAVFTSSNGMDGNAVLAFKRGADGSLNGPYAFPTGGRGTGGGLGNQDALVLDPSGRRLYVVNAGSDDVSVFDVRPDGLRLLQRISSGGDEPISLALRGNLLYVLNDGDAPNVQGFRVSRADGTLAPLAGSRRALSSAVPNAAQVGITPDGSTLVVTEKATNLVLSWALDRSGLPAAEFSSIVSNGATPFGFAFAGRGTLIVSEAFGGAPDASALSSYLVGRGAPPSLVSGSVGTTESAACWVVTTRNGRFAFTTNTASGTVSGYSVERDGSIALLEADGVSANLGAGSGPIDVALSRGDRFLYVLAGGANAIGIFQVRADGSLVPLGKVSGLPASANGLAVL